MPSRIDELRDHIARLEQALEIEIGEARDRWRYRVEAGRVRFEHDVQLAHQHIRQSIPAFLRESDPLSLLSAPVIYSLIVPISLIDLWITVYQPSASVCIASNAWTAPASSSWTGSISHT
jgi:hypothetical protein